MTDYKPKQPGWVGRKLYIRWDHNLVLAVEKISTSSGHKTPLDEDQHMLLCDLVDVLGVVSEFPLGLPIGATSRPTSGKDPNYYGGFLLSQYVEDDEWWVVPADIKGGNMTETELQAIEARANAATPGPWKAEHSGNDIYVEELNTKMIEAYLHLLKDDPEVTK